MRLQLFLALVAIGAALSEKVRYDGYKILEITPNTQEELTRLRKMEGFVDFWKDTNAVGRSAHIMVSPSQEKLLTVLFPKHRVLCGNVQDMMDREEKELAQRTVFTKGMDTKFFTVDEYHTYDEIVSWMEGLQTQYSKLVQLIDLGQTYDGNTLKMIKIGVPNPGKTKNAFWLDANIHAREWVAGATAVWTINELLTNYATNTNYQHYLNTIDIYIVPIFNVDGYEYTHTTDRNWRKTRSKQEFCYGVDPNRNWPFKWDDGGASNNPCSDTYAGPSANSEKIIQAATSFISAHTEIKGYMTLHSYSQMWFYPYAYAAHTYPPNVDQLQALSKQAVQAIYNVHQKTYQQGSPADILYDASGSSFDWTANRNIPWSFGMELRPTDNGFYGFQLPANQIVPTAEETWAGLQLIIQKVMAE